MSGRPKCASGGPSCWSAFAEAFWLRFDREWLTAGLGSGPPGRRAGREGLALATPQPDPGRAGRIFLSGGPALPAFLGRTFQPQDLAGKQPGAMLSYRLWQRGFGADPGIAGRTITLDGQPFVVVGVLPPRFWALSQRTGIRTPGPSHAPPNRTRWTARSSSLRTTKSSFLCAARRPWLERRPWSRPPAGNAGVRAGVKPDGGTNARPRGHPGRLKARATPDVEGVCGHAALRQQRHGALDQSWRDLFEKTKR